MEDWGDGWKRRICFFFWLNLTTGYLVFDIISLKFALYIVQRIKVIKYLLCIFFRSS